jgi:hypothetical protein
LDDITEVSDDLLENSVMSDHSKDTTVIGWKFLFLVKNWNFENCWKLFISLIINFDLIEFAILEWNSNSV